MYEVEKAFRFEAGHQLHHHDGPCAMPHGHSYKLVVTVRSNSLASSGPKKNMVLDFYEITAAVKPMIDTYFEHKWINDTLETDSPTVEFLSKWIFDFLSLKLPGLQSVAVFETENSKATYFIPK